VDNENYVRFDLLIIDLLMPELEGLQLIELVRQRWLYLPILVMTTELDEATEALDKGAISSR
jgi:DNA-binding response OmpR family regulator